MASFFIRRNSNVLARALTGNYKEPFCPHFQFKFECFGGALNRVHSYSRSSGSMRNDITDLTCPHTWYPQARRKRRRVFLHVGPTNSGKTHQALKQLQSSASGIYCGPLRLLAWEVAKRLNKANVPCDLITGQEREEVEGANHKAVTVEMADVSADYKCAVIDEIQMLGCTTRGYSFTRALLGIAADELHLCGDPAAVPLIQEILDVTGDEIEVQYYERLSPLVPMKFPLRSLSDVKNGDCIVTFSRRDIYKLKKRIEREGKHLCSVVYGSLPPETRTRQASMFNDASSELDVLVASDAIGMGLNLNISRIIFSTMQKFDGFEMRDLTVPEIKQIAGRAGRYGSNFPLGEVTCMYAEDLPLLHSSLDSPSPILERAGLLPSFDLLYMYSQLHPQTGFYQVLEHFIDNAKLSEKYFFVNCEQVLQVAAVIDEFPLGLRDKYLFCISPVDMDDEISSQGLTQFAENYAKKGLVRLREIFTPGTLRVPKTPSALKDLESIHKVLDLYVWLSFRLEDSFPDQELASSQKAICSMLIEEFLDRYGWQKPMAGRLPLRKMSSSLLSQNVRRYL
ncbi:DExH-box ATP-dependent RNA helicase DExH16, mitochondrial isoform X1 [Lathyrus oleraceus]|uniref:RNA helicase n=3 Tax=Pisum sativum TaxID=3888 RepID=A0A9D4YKT8_PEA|nr:DExH-box ATP-dependent RNA helicase DExH16, mitochondrial isoform X1 [Pisum sativum]XP_050907519.1 DExH-box ATP-dependent RNA helicase DExH16, mitochondrial isoform X1 [Pisum sativum]KAI5440284.1 RNA helicase [Pisum sativum]